MLFATKDAPNSTFSQDHLQAGRLVVGEREEKRSNMHIFVSQEAAVGQISSSIAVGHMLAMTG